MPRLIIDSANLNLFPSVIETKLDLAIGDMHGNVMKFLYILLRHGMASGLISEDYHYLLEIYRQNHQPQSVSKEKLVQFIADFDETLEMLIINPEVQKLILIGDLMADRGANDYFILKLLLKLRQELPGKIKIIFSNHDLQLLASREEIYHGLRQKEALAPRWLLEENVEPRYTTQFKSLLNLQYLIEQHIVPTEEVLELVDGIYQECLTLISYELHNDSPGISIFSHAPIGINTIQDLGAYFEVEYNDASPKALAATIDAINEAFMKKVKSFDIFSKLPADSPENIASHPVLHAAWNRHYDHLHRPPEHNGYKMGFYHGHDSEEPLNGSSYVATLDGFLGKGLNFEIGVEYLLTGLASPYPQLIWERSREVPEASAYTTPFSSIRNLTRMMSSSTFFSPEKSSEDALPAAPSDALPIGPTEAAPPSNDEDKAAGP